MRGLKYFHFLSPFLPLGVAPLAGAWIEIDLDEEAAEGTPVAPLAGAWIEIDRSSSSSNTSSVAPLAGAWIEITFCLLVI